MTNKFYAIILIGLCFLTSISTANDNKENKGAILIISVSETTEVQDDILTANLRYEFEGDDPKSVQNGINKVMVQAVAIAKKVDNITISTGQYNVYKNFLNPLNSANGKKEPIWNGAQGLDLKSKSRDNLLNLTGQLQDLGLILSGLSSVISPEKIEEARDSMMVAAIEKLLKKAHIIAKALGKSKIEIVQINIDSNNFVQYQQPIATMNIRGEHAGKMFSPIAEPGKSQVIMSVSANILIKE